MAASSNSSTAYAEQAIPATTNSPTIASGSFTANGETKITRRVSKAQDYRGYHYQQQQQQNQQQQQQQNQQQQNQDAESGSPSASMDFDVKSVDDNDNNEEEPITLPESTHSLLFSEPVCSLGFVFAAFIVILSYLCLLLSLFNNVIDGTRDNPLNVPFNVRYDVRIAQYLAIMIALLMEEEIPTALYLLRMIPKRSLHKQFPKMKFYKFFLSAMLRLLTGYLFLANTFMVVVQAEGVLDIFYDVLALQFLQHLDDIAFNLAKMDVFGKHLKKATTQKCFRVEFEKGPFGIRRSTSFFLKGLYFLNLAAMLAGLVLVSVNQMNGVYHCDSITVTFGDDIWEDALVITPSGELETQVLLFSYFNGVYVRGKETHDGRPVYIEQNKFDSSPFETTVPAVVKYCASIQAWVFSHENIRKSAESSSDSCEWLLKSHETTEYNLMEVAGEWTIWTGVLDGGTFSVMCNSCQEVTDCNYHGQCVEGRCICDPDDGWFGIRCQHMKPCNRITGGEGGSWDLGYVDENTIYRTYDLPVYVYDTGLSQSAQDANSVSTDTDMLALMFTGSRWFGTVQQGKKDMPKEYWINYSKEFHAFWEHAYSDLTRFVSDPTTKSSPVTVDFYRIGERGHQYGPFGQLFPFSDPKGSGFYMCNDDNSTEPIPL